MKKMPLDQIPACSLITIEGPSGVGKSTLVGKLIQQFRQSHHHTHIRRVSSLQQWQSWVGELLSPHRQDQDEVHVIIIEEGITLEDLVKCPLFHTVYHQHLSKNMGLIYSSLVPIKWPLDFTDNWDFVIKLQTFPPFQGLVEYEGVNHLIDF